MWDEFTWHKLNDAEIAHDVTLLRQEALRFFLIATTISYLSWQSVTAYNASADDFPRYWVPFPIVIIALGLTFLLHQHQPTWASICFVGSCIASLTVAAWTFQSSMPLDLYPVVVLVAVVTLNPLAGVVATAGILGTDVVLAHAGPLAFLGPTDIIGSGVASVLTVVAAWALGRNMVTAVGWSLNSYAQARQKTDAAQRHRAELVQALKQLDHAYYRLERANAALEIAWKAAEAAERSKAEFVTDISHELRTPLNLIVGFAEMIVTSPESYGIALPAAYRGDVNAIYRSAQHLLTLTDDVLDLARVGIGRLSLAREPMELGQIIQDACAIIDEYLAAKRLTLKIELSTDLPILTIDRLRIRQVLLNLLTNAARFTDRGGITVTAACLGSGGIIVKVADTGQGIAPENLSKVFAEYYHTDPQADEAQTRFRGVGLGLPLSKRFVELHGGQIGVASTPGVGSTFWFTLPGGPVTGDATDALPLVRVPSLHAQIERLLVLVDGGDSLAQFLQRHLRGCRVLAVSNVDQAVARATELRATALVADAENRFLDRCTKLPLPVVRLPLPLGDRLAAAFGVMAYLVKPVSRADVLRALSRVDRPIQSILIADDDERFVRLVSRYIRSLLSESQATIRVARNGREALALAEAEPPDVMLLDVRMPELSGDQVIAAMAVNPRLATVPVIIISTQEQGEDRLQLPGILSVETSCGFGLEQILNALEALVGILSLRSERRSDHVQAS